MQTHEKGISIINTMPRNNNVIIKMITNVPILELTSGKYSEETYAQNSIFEVVAVGPMVFTDLQIGDKVQLVIRESYIEVNVPTNDRSIKKLQAFYKSIGHVELNKIIADKKNNRVEVNQYGLFPEFDIKAIIY